MSDCKKLLEFLFKMFNNPSQKFSGSWDLSLPHFQIPSIVSEGLGCTSPRGRSPCIWHILEFFYESEKISNPLELMCSFLEPKFAIILDFLVGARPARMSPFMRFWISSPVHSIELILIAIDSQLKVM